MTYHHVWLSGEAMAHPPGKVVCIGMNYWAHIQELQRDFIPQEPVFFMKPKESLANLLEPLVIPSYTPCHHEVELAVLIGQPLSQAQASEVFPAVAGYGIGLDLTLREVQNDLKKKGLPWELAKAFDGSCPLSPFVPASALPAPQETQVKLSVNGQVRQDASTALMIHQIADLIAAMSRHFKLMPGDVIMTGTPQGVGVLQSGDQLVLELNQTWGFSTSVR